MDLVEALSTPPKSKVEHKEPKILTIDIETSPNLAHVWNIFQENVGISQIIEAQDVLCFAAKWYGSRQVEYYSQYEHGKEIMLKGAHQLLDEADVVVHYNGKRFDIPHLHREFLLADMPPPVPYRHVDLYQIIRQRFKFTSNKLDFVSQQLGIGEKVHNNVDHSLWKRCLADDPAAWRLMERYNKQDVLLTEKVFERIRPWLGNAIHMGLYANVPNCCPSCGSTQLISTGMALTPSQAYPGYICQDCGAPSRGNKAIRKTTTRTTL